MLVLNNLIEFLKQEGVSAQLVEEVRHYSEEHTVDEALKKRIPVPHFHYYGNKVWEEALAVLLCGRNLLLAGEKATGKNVLAQNLAAVFERPAWENRTEYAKTFAVSDLHGRFDLFAAILKTGEVINDKYEWIYGSNHLVIDGDIFDRGADVLPILWLIYKLEFEAKTVGGRVTTILGDHEEMIMRDNLKYTYAKYNTLSQRAMNMTYGKMWGLTNVMGNWLCSKNTIQIVGENLYVHAGLSKVFMEREETIPEINELVSKSIYLSKEERKKQYPDIADFLYSDSYNGPLWYRGMVKTGSEYSPIKEADVDKLLAQYDVKRIIIGHTENSRVKYTYNKKVYDICVNHPKAFEKETRAVVIEGDDIKAINDEGELVTIKK